MECLQNVWIGEYKKSEKEKHQTCRRTETSGIKIEEMLSFTCGLISHEDLCRLLWDCVLSQFRMLWNLQTHPGIFSMPLPPPAPARKRINSTSKKSGTKSKKDTNDLIDKEKLYQELNAELEARTAYLVREAEGLIKDQPVDVSESRVGLINLETSHITSNLLDHINPDEFLHFTQFLSASSHNQMNSAAKPSVSPHQQNSTKHKVSSTRAKPTSSKLNLADDVAVPDETYLNDLQDTFQQISDQQQADTDLNPSIDSSQQVDDILPPTLNEIGSEAIIRFLKAKLRVMQEELENLSQQCEKKEEDRTKLQEQVKQMDEERSRLQRMSSNQLTQLENYKKLIDDGKQRIEGLETQVVTQKRELEHLKRNFKKEGTLHKATDVRLNRALEEMEKYKEQVQKTKTDAKDHSSNDKKRIEQLLAENRMLEKQKNELMTGFRKQMKLIDILKKQKMHIEASKMLTFTEEEFVKAMEWET
ncbi:Hypothetical predicted protein [Octopus vulgaris]|uniref:Testis-expressed protein 9 n=1 Tax=Octopus vulgaris TaxID=6645 RepID=A0AA36BKE0_OCTVU|nr:Hypothetical predicted protein [Octopus vulgaris]